MLNRRELLGAVPAAVVGAIATSEVVAVESPPAEDAYEAIRRELDELSQKYGDSFMFASFSSRDGFAWATATGKEPQGHVVRVITEQENEFLTRIRNGESFAFSKPFHVISTTKVG